jgi:hypothetical protein
MDNDDAKHVLLTVRRMVLEGYPYPKGTTLDDRYALAFGLIAGMCTEAIQAVSQNRPVMQWEPEKVERFLNLLRQSC